MKDRICQKANGKDISARWSFESLDLITGIRLYNQVDVYLRHNSDNTTLILNSLEVSN